MTSLSVRAPQQQLSEAEAWREIARRIAERTHDARHRGPYLCNMAHQLRSEELVATDREQQMEQRARSHCGVGNPDVDVFESVDPRDDEPCFEDFDGRVLAALFLALEAEDEA